MHGRNITVLGSNYTAAPRGGGAEAVVMEDN